MVTRERRAQETRELAAAQGRAARTGSASSNAATDAYGKQGGRARDRRAHRLPPGLSRWLGRVEARRRSVTPSEALLGKMDEHVAAMEALTARAKDDE